MTQPDTFEDIVAQVDAINELKSYQRHLLDHLSSGELNEQTVISWFDSFAGPGTTAPFSAGDRARPYYDKFRNEVFKLLCSKNHYVEERAQIVGDFKAGQATVSTSIAAAIAPHMEAAPAILVPAVAVLLTLVSKMGLNAWCEVQRERQEQGPPD